MAGKGNSHVGPIFAIVSLLLCSGRWSVIAGESSYDITWRYPVIAIPRLQPPLVDAHIGDTEWARATLLPQLLVMEPSKGSGMPLLKPTWMWMGYTQDSLYMAFRQELPESLLPLEVSVTDQRDACEGPDNAINVFLCPDPNKGEMFHFSFNAASQIYDRRLDDPMGVHWNANITYRSRLTGDGWEGEVQIPFTELGLSTAPPDAVSWKCNLFSFWRKREPVLSCWPFVRWRSQGETGVILFGGDIPGVRFEKPGEVQSFSRGWTPLTS